MQGQKLVTLCRIAARLDSEEVGKHALAAQIYDVLATQVDLSPEGKKLLQDFFGFGINGESDFEVGDFGENVPEADYQTKRDPFRDPSAERMPEPKSDMLASVNEAATALENQGEFRIARALRDEFGA